MHKEHIEQIIKHGDNQQMMDMKELLIDLIDCLKYSDYDKYLWTEYELTKIANHGHMGEKLAKCWVSKMENKDGTTGEHWNWEQITNLMKEKGLHCDASDFYAAMNMVYSDFFNTKFDITIYYDMAKDWLQDKDVKDNKLLKYYFYIVK